MVAPRQQQLLLLLLQRRRCATAAVADFITDGERVTSRRDSSVIHLAGIDEARGRLSSLRERELPSASERERIPRPEKGDESAFSEIELRGWRSTTLSRSRASQQSCAGSPLARFIRAGCDRETEGETRKNDDTAAPLRKNAPKRVSISTSSDSPGHQKESPRFRGCRGERSATLCPLQLSAAEEVNGRIDRRVQSSRRFPTMHGYGEKRNRSSSHRMTE